MGQISEQVHPDGTKKFSSSSFYSSLNHSDLSASNAEAHSAQGSDRNLETTPITPETAEDPGMISRPKWSPHRAAGITLVLAAAALFVFKTGALTQEAAIEEPEQAALPVMTTPLKPVSSYSVDRTYTGELTSRRASDLGLELTGTLIEINVDEGDRIQKGSVLARLDTRNLDAQKKQLLAQKAQAFAQLKELKTGPRVEEIEAARATVADLKQQYALAQKQSDRRKTLFEQGAVSRESYDERFFNAEALKQRQEQAQQRLEELLAGTRSEQVESQDAQLTEIDARIEALEIQRTKSVLIAPFAGRVSQRFVDEGVVLSPGQPILRLVEAGSMEARIGVPQAIADTLNIGSSYPIQVGSKTFSGQIRSLLPEVDAQNRTVTAILEFQGNDTINLGQTAKMTLTQTTAAQGYWLPSTAIIAGNRGLWSTYVLKQPVDKTETDQAETDQAENAASGSSSNASAYNVVRRDVEVIHTDGDRVLVRGMLTPGEEVISEGTHRIATGQRVRKINQP